jgi:two-component system, cell cycle sensor histidine kinase and response regulator CckA
MFPVQIPGSIVFGGLPGRGPSPVRPAAMTQVTPTRPLERPAEEAFDRLTRLAARLLGAPVALVSVMGEDRAFLKSAVGVPEPWASERAMPLAYSFCRHVIASGAPLVVEDTRRQPLVRSNPAIRELSWISYAGVPLTTGDGQTAGALCVIDALPRIWSPRDVALLQDLAASVVTEMELRSPPLRGEPGPRDPAADVFEVSALPMGLVESDGRWLRVNRALAELLGTTVEALAGRPAELSTHPADRTADHEAVRLLLAGECDSYTAEKRVLGAGGEPRWVLATVTAFPVGPGVPPRFHVALTDIGDRKQAEVELREREERFRLAAEAAQDAVWDWDLLTDRITWDEPAEGTFGYRYATPGATAAWWYERLHADDRERAVSGIHAAIARGATEWTEEYRFRAADGRYVHVRDCARIVRDEAGDAVRMVGGLTDVTERVRSEEALGRSNRLLEQVLDHLPVGVWVLDRDGLIRFANPASRVIWGGARFVGLDDFGEFHGWRAATGDPIAPGEWAAARAIRKGETTLGEVVHIESFDGAHRTMLNSAVPLRALDGGIIGAIALQQDITDQRAGEEALRRSEDQLRHSQKLEAVGQLAGGIAHDFNNLLTGILSYSDLILQELRADDPIRGDIEQIRHAGQRAAGLTRQLLAFGRRQVLQPRVLSLNACVGEVDAMLRRVVGAGVTLENELDSGLWHVLADPGQLEQVLVNLVINARDAMPDGGRVTVTTANLHLTATDDARGNGVRPGAYVTLSVSDTGVGMDVQTQARIFEPFFTTKESGKGTGLGLSTVYGIVEQSGGHIEVESAPGQGATFTIFLPRDSGAVAAAARPTDRRSFPGGTETLLLVEDEAAVRGSARRLLERHGYTVIEARHGADALRIIEAGDQAVDLVITDVVMPEMGGRELVERLRTRHPGVKVLFMSGYSERTVASDGVMPPGTGFVEKPFTIEQLTRRTRELLDG